MEPMILGLIGVGIFLLLVFGGMRIAFAGLTAGFIGLLAFYGYEPTVAAFRGHVFTEGTKYALTVIPLFVLMGYFGFYSGVGDEVYAAARQWVGQLRGGLAMGTTLSCAVFGAISGSSTAASAMFGKMAIPEMDKHGYDRRLSLGTVAASGTLASLIPPSTTIVIYGYLTEQSVGKLLIAGILPGIVSAIIYCIMIYFRVLKNPKLGPPARRTSFKEKFMSLRPLWAVIVIFIVVIGGLYLGVFTPTEAGAIGAMAMLIVTLARRMLTWKKARAAILETARISCMIFAVIIGIKLFTTLMVATGVTASLVNSALGLTPALLLVGIIVIYIIFGCFIGVLGMLVTTLPFVFPVVVAAGFDPIWFGIIVIKLCEVAMITPPIGINVFVTSNATGAPVEQAFRSVIPFFIMDIVTIGVLIAFPQIILLLPSMM